MLTEVYMEKNRNKCNVCNKKSQQKSHHQSHLDSNSHKSKSKILELELEKLSLDELKNKYGITDIKEIVKIVSGIYKPYEMKKVKKSNKVIFSLTNEEKLNNKKEDNFKNIFIKKLSRWHNLLSGAGTTGDPALDDIINILVLCYLQDKISDKGLFDLKNSKHYGPASKQRRIEKNYKYLSLKYWLNHTDEIRPNDGKSAIDKVGEILTLHPVTGRIFKNITFLKCSKPLIISKLINEIFTFTKTSNIFQYQDLIGIAYEMWVNKYLGKNGKELGNYFTERELMRMCFELIDKDDLLEFNINNESIIGDEFCGTFGFPLYLKKFLNKKFNINIKSENMYGIEFEDRASRFGIINAMFSINTFNNVIKGDSFQNKISPHLDISVHNVPFGHRMKSAIIKEEYNNYKNRNSNKNLPDFDDIIDVKINKDCVLTSQLVLYKTKKIGLCILKDGEETSGVGQFIKYRKFFCDNCIIKKIVKIPSGCFTSTGTKTVCIYFVKKEGYSTESIQFLELNSDCTKMIEICNVSIKDIKNNYYSWNSDDYIVNERLEKLLNESNCEFKKLEKCLSFVKTIKRSASYGKNKGEYPFITSSLKIDKYVDMPDYEKPSIIIGDGGKANINYGEKFSVSNHCHVLCNNNRIFVKYIYYYLLNNLDQLEQYYIGAGLKNIKKENIKKILVPQPDLDKQKSVVTKLDDLSLQKKILLERIDGIKRQVKYHFENKLKESIIEVKKLRSIIDVNIGSTPSTKNNEYWNEGKHLHISVKELNNTLIPITDSNKKLTDKALEECKPKIVKKGTILMSFKLSIGKLGIAGCDLYTNEAIVRMNTGDKKLNEWLYYYFYTFKPQGASGSIGNGNLNKTKLKELDVLMMTDKKERIKLVDKLNLLQDKIISYTNEINEIDKLMKDILKKSYNVKKKENEKIVIVKTKKKTKKKNKNKSISI